MLPGIIEAPHSTHDARHTFVTMMSNYEINEKTIKTIVGHAGGNNVTEDVYMHKNLVQLLDAVNRLPFGNGMFISPQEKEKSGGQVVATD